MFLDISSHLGRVESDLREWQESIEHKIAVTTPFVLPSPRVPLFLGMVIGALIFAAGIFVGTFLK